MKKLIKQVFLFLCLGMSLCYFTTEESLIYGCGDHIHLFVFMHVLVWLFVPILLINAVFLYFFDRGTGNYGQDLVLLSYNKLWVYWGYYPLVLLSVGILYLLLAEILGIFAVIFSFLVGVYHDHELFLYKIMAGPMWIVMGIVIDYIELWRVKRYRLELKEIKKVVIIPNAIGTLAGLIYMYFWCWGD